MIKFDNSGGNSLSLTNSIIDEPGTLTLSTPDTIDLTADNLVTNDGTTLPAKPSIVLGEPQYVDLANHDYHLMPTSLGVDFAPAAGGVDLDGRARDIDLPVKPDFLGPRDLGAYEVQPSCGVNDTIFCNGFDSF